jgi:hypothetical protein
MNQNVEKKRLEEEKLDSVPWKKWGPYLSERQWGTVREDYSESGNAWDSFSHDQARSRAYRWGEDGLAGISDDKQSLCFALALWNGKDPILKERLFGLTNSEGNHGEDVKEYYYYLDSTPTHSYMKYLYKYPQAEFPYHKLVVSNRYRNRNEFEYELIDTGVFEDNRYFDVFVEYAKASPDDVLIKISVYNRGDQDARIQVLPTLWFRNTWAYDSDVKKPNLHAVAGTACSTTVEAVHDRLGKRYLYAEGQVPLLFTENETNEQRINGRPNASPYVKDGINNYIVRDMHNAINPQQIGTKVSAHFELDIPAGQVCTVRVRLSDADPDRIGQPFGDNFESVLTQRLKEADEFYKTVIPENVCTDEANVMRQALAGMLWSKQYYLFDGVKWLREHGFDPLSGSGHGVRNKEWFHMLNDDIISMPDKWEYPWYAAWDLAFHTITLAMVDIEFAKKQLSLMLGSDYLHPNGQIPAYEWNFSDVNPPVHAWAAVYLYTMEKQQTGKGDFDFLKKVFGKLTSNFTWWVNRKDRFGKNVFEGGFLGLDNISVFDRSAPLPTGGYLEQADGTAWMALFCQNMMEIAMHLSVEDPSYEEHVLKFSEHFVWIAAAINKVNQTGLWDEQDGFYYDLLRLPNGQAKPLRVRSMVGLLPLCAATVVEPDQRAAVPNALKAIYERLEQMPEILNVIHKTGPGHLGYADRGIIALVNEERLRRLLSKMLDEKEFLSDFGIRSLSRYHADHPFVTNVQKVEYRVDYLPAESNTGLFGGNSNWRGPIWLSVNALIVRALLQYYLYYGDDFKVECPTGSGNMMTLFEVSQDLSKRLSKIFLRDSNGRRPVYGGTKKFQEDPHFRDHILFYEYFHGDNGAGLGASHQTGWTGIVARLMQLFAQVDSASALKSGKRAGFRSPQEAGTKNSRGDGR